MPILRPVWPGRNEQQRLARRPRSRGSPTGSWRPGGSWRSCSCPSSSTSSPDARSSPTRRRCCASSPRSAATASAVRAIEQRLAGAPRPRRWRESPLMVCAHLAAASLSTLMSIQPRVSVWGSHVRLEELVTLLAHLTVFACLATRLRRRAQLDRLLDAVVAASLPVCVYGFLQGSARTRSTGSRSRSRSGASRPRSASRSSRASTCCSPSR